MSTNAPLRGKGFFIWKIYDCERGDPEGIASAASTAGFSHVLLKIADGNYPYNIDNKSKVDLVPPVVDALRKRNLQVWGWHYVYGYEPLAEARIAIRRIQQFNLDGYVIDAEGEYKAPDRATAARRYMGALRSALPDLPMALSSYRFPTYHPQLPWREFLEQCNYNMPQVYWEKAHNPAAQLARTIKEFQAISPFRPIIPTGAAYKWNGWRPSEADLKEFLEAVRQANIPATNFFSWDECRRDLPEIWDVIAKDSLGSPVPPSTQPPAPKDITALYVDALNSRDVKAILNLYHPDAVHITAARTIQGPAAIRAWYEAILRDPFDNATFALSTSNPCSKGESSSRHFTWSAGGEKGGIAEGSDTLGLKGGKIIYHYTSYSLK